MPNPMRWATMPKRASQPDLFIPRPDTTPAACLPGEIAEHRTGDPDFGRDAQQRPADGRTPCNAADYAHDGSGQSVGNGDPGTSRGACGHVTAAPTIPGDCFLCMGGLPCLSPAECGIGSA